MRNTFVLLVAAVLLSACDGSPKSDGGTKDGVYHINYEECLANERTLRLSEIADTIEYLELKTPDDLIITFVINVIPVEDLRILSWSIAVTAFLSSRGMAILSPVLVGAGKDRENISGLTL